MSLSIDEILNPFGGKSNNDLNNILNIDEVPDPDDEIVDFCKTTYLSSEELGHYLLEHKNELTILSFEYTKYSIQIRPALGYSIRIIWKASGV